MELREQLNGIQHVGIPTNDIEMTIAFYEKLGFEIAFRTVNEAADEKVAFLKLGTLVIETYENKAAALKPGAIDHVAIDVKNIEKVHEMITGAGLNTTQDEVHFLPFWENGVRFFTIEGPNKEKSGIQPVFVTIPSHAKWKKNRESCLHEYPFDQQSLCREAKFLPGRGFFTYSETNTTG